MLARAALETLCQDWGLHDRYVAELRAFVAGVDWDDGQARLTAIACAGEYLERRFDRVLLELLLDIFEDPTARDVVRHEAYVALAVAAG